MPPGGDGLARATVPAGRIRLVRPPSTPSKDVRQWETGATVTVTAGGEARIEMP
jgi:hypothetical protein